MEDARGGFRAGQLSTRHVSAKCAVSMSHATPYTTPSTTHHAVGLRLNSSGRSSAVPAAALRTMSGSSMPYCTSALSASST